MRAIVWGRNIYDSIAKFLQFQLTVNVVAIIIAMGSALVLSNTPLKAAQLLWVNLIMDTLASLALATEPPTDALLNRKPYGRSKSLISKTMFKNMFFQSIYQVRWTANIGLDLFLLPQITVIVVILAAGPELLDFSTANFVDTGGLPTVHYTMIFHTFVVMTLFNQFNARKIHNERNAFFGIMDNAWFVGIWIAEFGLQALIVEFAGLAMQTAPLPASLWMWSLAFGSGVILWQQLASTVPTAIFPDWSSVKAACGCRKQPRQRESLFEAANRISETSIFMHNPRMKRQLHEVSHVQENISRSTSPPLNISTRDSLAADHLSHLKGRSSMHVPSNDERVNGSNNKLESVPEEGEGAFASEKKAQPQAVADGEREAQVESAQ